MKNSRKWRRVPCGLAAIGVLFAATACGPQVKTEEDRYEEEIQGVRATYEGYLRNQTPDYVVITYPESASALNDHARRVFQTIRGVLNALRIPNECRRLDDVLTTFRTRVRKREYVAYRVPTALTESRKVTVLYINLCMVGSLETKTHPDAVAREITVRVWNDPSTRAARSPVL